MFDGFSPSGDVAQSARDGSDNRCGRECCNVGWKRAQYLRVNLSVGCAWIAWTQCERKRTPSPPAVHHYPCGSDDADVCTRPSVAGELKGLILCIFTIWFFPVCINRFHGFFD